MYVDKITCERRLESNIYFNLATSRFFMGHSLKESIVSVPWQRRNLLIFLLSSLIMRSCQVNLLSPSHRFRFRRGFKQFFRCCPFVHVGPEVLTRREVVTSRYSCTGSPDHHRIVRNGKSTNIKSFNFTEWSFNRSHWLTSFLPTDTERSFLYAACTGSPKSHRKSHGEFVIALSEHCELLSRENIYDFKGFLLWRRELLKYFAELIKVSNDQISLWLQFFPGLTFQNWIRKF